MNFIRKIIDSNSIATIMDLPVELKNKKVEVIVLPVDDDPKEKKNTKSLKGILNKYSNPDLIKEEEEAWQMAVEEKYEDS
ncbi:hypothetical protein [Halonatronum saccharophilum]|uniref:hypothetical protein n=1 Tax=Halonatronum saccharophilum TaxID=150060 RepID=UPI0004833F45|nr:hypothetical protein [Halonatronum saccharophilum]